MSDFEDEFTPTTEQARAAFIQGSDEDGSGGDFDRWLAQRDRAIWDEAADLIESHWAPDTAEGREIVEGSAELLRGRAALEHDEVCPYEDCPYPVPEGEKNCGNHEEWMT